MNQGYLVSAITPDLFPPFHTSVEAISISNTTKRVVKALPAAIKSRAQQSALIKAGVSLKPDLIYVIDPETLRPAAAIKLATGAKLIYDAHEFHEQEDPSRPERGEYVRRTESKFAAHVDCFITVNQSIADLYREAQPILPSALVVRNVMDCDLSSPAYDGALHKMANLPADRKILLYQGNLQPMRGIGRLLEIAYHLPEDWTTIFIGQGPLHTQIDERAAKLPSNTVLRIPAVPREELYALTAGAALGAILYEEKGLNQHFCSPNKLWEFPACGVPLLINDLPEMQKALTNGAPGISVGLAEDAEAVAKKITRFKTTKTTRKSAKTYTAENLWANEFAPVLEWVAKA